MLLVGSLFSLAINSNRDTNLSLSPCLYKSVFSRIVEISAVKYCRAGDRHLRAVFCNISYIKLYLYPARSLVLPSSSRGDVFSEKCLVLMLTFF